MIYELRRVHVNMAAGSLDSVTTAGSSNVGVRLCQFNLSPENEIFFEKFTSKFNLISIVGGLQV